MSQVLGNFASTSTRGTFKCVSCSRSTTGADGDLSTQLCDPCYEMAGIYNDFQDGNMDEGVMTADEVKNRISEILEISQRITSVGGKLDGDARAMIMWVATRQD